MKRPLRWGILGTASICDRTIPAIRRSKSELRAVASRDPGKAERFAARHAIPLSYGSYEAILASGEVDAVYVPLPNALHAEWTLRALDAGLHVLCEKPLTVNAAEAREVAAAAARTGRIVVEAFMYRHHPLYGRVLDLLHTGIIGPVVSLDSEFSFFLDEPDSIVASAALGGGALADVGCYCVNFSRLITGSEPRRVAAFATGDTVDDSMTGILQFPGGILARFVTSIRTAERHQAQIHGTTGTLLLESPWHPGDKQATIRVQRHGKRDEIISVTGDDPYCLLVEDFASACLGASPPRWPIEDAVANMDVLDALRRSSRNVRA